MTSKTSTFDKLEGRNPVLWMSGAFIIAFITLALFNQDLLKLLIDKSFAWSIAIFGPYWQVLMFSTFIVSLLLAFGRTGRTHLGDMDKPEIDTFRWMAIVLCTLLAGGGVFWAAAEPIAHFLSPPPLHQAQSNVQLKAVNALAQSFMHWGFLAWTILGSLSTIVYMHLHYNKGLPLKPRTLLYPIFGERIIHSFWGSLVDACAIIAVAAGTIGPIGFLGLQVSYALNTLFDIPDVFLSQLIIVSIAIVIYTVSALTGLNRGIQFLSRWNVIIALALMAYILIFGPTGFIINSYIQGVGTLVDQFIPMSTYRGDEEWLGWWTVFFWGWFIGYGPMMAIFIARISRGRTIFQLFLGLSIASPLITCFWFTVVGGTGVAFEMATPGSVGDMLYSNGGFNLPGALLAITGQLPLSTFISITFLILTTIFIVTTGDSMTYTISVVISGDVEPNAAIRIFWGVVMGVTAIILISMGEGSIGALQSFIVITAVPVSLLMLPAIWAAPKYAREMAYIQTHKSFAETAKSEIRKEMARSKLANH